MPQSPCQQAVTMAANRGSRCSWPRIEHAVPGRKENNWIRSGGGGLRGGKNATCLAFRIERSARVAGVVVRARDMSGAIDSGLQRRVRVEANRPPDEQLEHRDWIGEFREPFLDS